jgi:hypothetical protein
MEQEALEERFNAARFSDLNFSILDMSMKWSSIIDHPIIDHPIILILIFCSVRNTQYGNQIYKWIDPSLWLTNNGACYMLLWFSGDFMIPSFNPLDATI